MNFDIPDLMSRLQSVLQFNDSQFAEVIGTDVTSVRKARSGVAELPMHSRVVLFDLAGIEVPAKYLAMFLPKLALEKAKEILESAALSPAQKQALNELSLSDPSSEWNRTVPGIKDLVERMQITLKLEDVPFCKFLGTDATSLSKVRADRLELPMHCKVVVLHATGFVNLASQLIDLLPQRTKSKSLELISALPTLLSPKQTEDMGKLVSELQGPSPNWQTNPSVEGAGFHPKIEQALEMLAASIQSLNPSKRMEVSSNLAALGLAPDSSTLIRSLKDLLVQRRRLK